MSKLYLYYRILQDFPIFTFGHPQAFLADAGRTTDGSHDMERRLRGCEEQDRDRSASVPDGVLPGSRAKPDREYPARHAAAEAVRDVQRKAGGNARQH